MKMSLRTGSVWDVLSVSLPSFSAFLNKDKRLNFPNGVLTERVVNYDP